MPLNKALVGKEYPPNTTDATLEAMQRYGRAYNDDNRAYFDAAAPGGIIAPPMYAVVVTWPSVMSAVGDPDLKVDIVRLLHGEQDMEFFRPIRPGDKISSTAKVASIETKATGETMVLEINAVNQDGERVQRTLFSVFIRGGGKGAGEAKAPEPDRGQPIATVAQQIDKDQTYRYKEASGDINPIHVDESFAKMAGLPGIIVHGLCTMAFTVESCDRQAMWRRPDEAEAPARAFFAPGFPRTDHHHEDLARWRARWPQDFRLRDVQSRRPAGDPRRHRGNREVIGEPIYPTRSKTITGIWRFVFFR